MPTVSVLITTYNRKELLARAINSVLKQDFADYEIVVIDDCSTDGTKEAMAALDDPRIRYVRNEVNVGGKDGDLPLIKRFIDEFCRGEYFVYLCDDDYWRPSDLLSRQIAAFHAHPSLAFVQGGMTHCYPHPVPSLAPNEPYVTYSFVDGRDSDVFWGTIYPPGFMTGAEYLRLFAADPKNRNLVTGATLFNVAKFRAAGALERAIAGVRWQAGYAIVGGAATQGDVFYIDEPCVMTANDRSNASHRGTQLMHLLDCIASINAAFDGRAEYADIKHTFARSVFKVFMCNKIAHKWGWFAANAMGDISDIMVPPISSAEFTSALTSIPLSEDNLKLIEVCDLPLDDMLRAIGWRWILEMSSGPRREPKRSFDEIWGGA